MQHLILVQSPCSSRPSNARILTRARDHDYKICYKYDFHSVLKRPPNYLFIVRNPSRAPSPSTHAKSDFGTELILFQTLDRSPLHRRATMITKHVIGMICLVCWDALQTICSLSEIHHALSLPPSHIKSDFGNENMLLQTLERPPPSQTRDHDYKTCDRYKFPCVLGRPPNYVFIVRNPSRALPPPLPCKSDLGTEAMFLQTLERAPPHKRATLITKHVIGWISSVLGRPPNYLFSVRNPSRVLPPNLRCKIWFWYRIHLPPDPRTPPPHNRATMITKQAIVWFS